VQCRLSHVSYDDVEFVDSFRFGSSLHPIRRSINKSAPGPTSDRKKEAGGVALDQQYGTTTMGVAKSIPRKIHQIAIAHIHLPLHFRQPFCAHENAAAWIPTPKRTLLSESRMKAADSSKMTKMKTATHRLSSPMDSSKIRLVERAKMIKRIIARRMARCTLRNKTRAQEAKNGTTAPKHVFMRCKLRNR
jgi:hypothetical protein